MPPMNKSPGMRKWLARCAVVAALIGIVVLAGRHQRHPPGIWTGPLLPPGKVRPQLVNAWLYEMLLAPDGSLWAWGGSEQSPLPSSLSPQDTMLQIPRRVGSDTNWTQVACCQDYQVALKNDGSLWTWGFNQSGPTPTRIGTENDWSQICAGGGHNLTLKKDGSLWTWDSNERIKLGDGTITNSPVPTMVGTNRDWRMIAAGFRDSFALKSNGTVWEWGTQGAAGDNLSPRQISPDTNWQSISADPFGLVALKTDGTLWVNSSNTALIASDFVRDRSRYFTQIGPDADWAEVYAVPNSFFARKRDGSWWVFGLNRFGQFGLGTNIMRVVSPQRLPFDFDPWAFASGLGTTFMLGKDGKLWTWGVRLGASQRSATRQKFEAFVAPLVQRFPALHFLIKSNIDQTPHLLWDLPPEVRRALGTGPNGSTNNLTDGHSADTLHQ
jgi:alpha-tubulin suppressor-like RCC1 family protein